MTDKYKDRILDLLDTQWWYYIGQYHTENQLAYYEGIKTAIEAMLILEHSTVERSEQGKHRIVDLPQ